MVAGSGPSRATALARWPAATAALAGFALIEGRTDLIHNLLPLYARVVEVRHDRIPQRQWRRKFESAMVYPQSRFAGGVAIADCLERSQNSKYLVSRSPAPGGIEPTTEPQLLTLLRSDSLASLSHACMSSGAFGASEVGRRAKISSTLLG